MKKNSGAVRVRGIAVVVVRLGAHLVVPFALAAQQPSSQQPPTAVAPYRAPTIALVQPPPGGTVPRDKPVVVFRFAHGEPSDPIDATSFRVAVDGTDRSALFQVSATEAWGPLGVARPEASADSLAVGAHQMEARICSSRGTCAITAATVTVMPAPVKPNPASPTDRKARLLDLLLTAAKRLIEP